MLKDAIYLFKKGWLGATGIMLGLTGIGVIAATFPILVLILVVCLMFISAAIIMGTLMS